MKGLRTLIAVFLVAMTDGCIGTAEKVIFPTALELVNAQSEKDTVCFSCVHQVVVFQNFDEISFSAFSERYLWQEIKNQFPQVGFVFYFSGKDREKLIEGLEALKFPFPVYYDPEFEFYRKNRLDTVNSTYDVLHAFHLKDGYSVKWAQIGMQGAFIDELKEILDTEEI